MVCQRQTVLSRRLNLEVVGGRGEGSSERQSQGDLDNDLCWASIRQRGAGQLRRTPTALLDPFPATLRSSSFRPVPTGGPCPPTSALLATSDELT